ncbi:MAG: 1-deoxy-D-xylulose-5-phosphate reductoisomerase [Alphaproteobacteria bacterium]
MATTGIGMAKGQSSCRSVTILGATGSIGESTVDLILRHPDRYRVEALAAHSRVERLAELARLLRPRFVAVADPNAGPALREALAGTGVIVGAGPEAVVEAAEYPSDWVMAAIVGAAGLKPTLAAIRRGATVALANKEAMVCAGDLVMAEVHNHGATLLPVDSEHNAIFQVFEGTAPERIEKLILTASGGPFRDRDLEYMSRVTPAQAVAHPNWSMGAKISVDSATMMNKGLELIEAHHLFRMPETRIDILVHPQSVVHSLVAYIDGSVLAQLGSPDMRTPIAYALGWPERIHTPSPRLDLAAVGNLEFRSPDPVRFPSLRLARQALQSGGSAPTILNAANEVAVQRFLSGVIGFLSIAEVVERTLQSVPSVVPVSVDDVLEMDGRARRVADEIVRTVCRPE